MKTIKIAELSKFGGYRFLADEKHLDVEQSDWWTAITEKQYNKITNQLDKVVAKGKGYKIYVWYDVSGFEYWVNNMQEPNYAQITISFDNDVINPKQIPTLIKKLDRVVNKVDDIIYQFN